MRKSMLAVLKPTNLVIDGAIELEFSARSQVTWVYLMWL
jgi:hypothetical protein